MSLQYKGFTLDPFQEESIQSINNNNSVVVSAATGTGKTLIADYIIDQAIQNKWQVIYTAPIKALSNQKFRDFVKDYGDNIGLLTGDVVINPDAPVRIMTTEIYRNMLMDKEPFDQLKYVIFDEIHFINDPERGTVWEESIIFSPEHVRFLCLSATIPNYQEFADWIATIKGHEVDTVHYGKRAVPLSHFVYDKQLGIAPIEKIKGIRREKQTRNNKAQPDHRDLIKELQIQDWLPCIYFSFSRAASMDKAKEAARKFEFITNQEKVEILEIFNEIIPKDIRQMHSVQTVKYLVTRGVGVHHAGILPPLKQLVEELFGKGLLKMLYATETFAIGINMPARTVAFNSLLKYDGRSFRYLHAKEYFQMAGRAGRRGIDKVGRAITMIDRTRLDQKGIARATDIDMEPINSQFKLSYNTVLNLLKNYDEKTRNEVLQSNFGYYVAKQGRQQVRIMTSFANYTRRLQSLGYIQDDNLTWKGQFGSYIYTKEIAISEMVFDNMCASFSDEQLLLVLASLVYEPKPADHYVTKGAKVNQIMKIIDRNKEVNKNVNFSTLKRLYHITRLWYNGSSFDDLLEMCNLAEGDIIRLFRQTIDITAQIKHALIRIDHYPELVDRLSRISKKIDRDMVAVEFSA